MPLSEKIQQLEEQIRQRFEQSLGEMRQEMLERFRTQSETFRQQLEALRPGATSELLREADLEPIVREASEEARKDEAERARHTGGSLAGLRESLAALDTARSQGDLLQALLTQCGKFASRAAVFLAQPGRLQGWGGHGLGDPTALRALSVEAPEGSPWSRLLAGQGIVHLGSAERAEVASRLEVPIARNAVLLPLMLRDRVAGAVYADRTGDEPLAVEGLQALTYVTALAIETLPLRRRESTPTLKADAETSAEAPRDAPWDAAPEAAAQAPAETPPAIPEPTPPAPPPPMESVEEVAVSPAEMDEVSADDFGGDLGGDMGGDLGGDLGAQEDDLGLGDVDLEDEDDEISLDDVESQQEHPVAGFSSGLTSGPETASLDELSTGDEQFTGEEAVEIAPPAPEAEADAGPSAWSLESEPQAEAPTREASGPDASPQAPTEAPPPAPEALSTTSAEPLEQAPSVPSAPAAPADGAGGDEAPPGSSEVAPPSDVQGPGWAFAGAEEMDGDEEARHEEARRLARLLVSEIKLYNEEHVMAGRQSNDIFERLKDDIERSRQLYDARVDERVREKTDYFYQEMVRVLGAGDPKTLGI